MAPAWKAVWKLTQATQARYFQEKKGALFPRLLTTASMRSKSGLRTGLAWRVFDSVFTQWRVGMGIPTGLDYAAVYPFLDRAAKDPQEWDEMFSDIQVMEGAVFKQMSDNRSDN